MERALSLPSGIRKRIPVLDWLPHYHLAWLRPDIIAALTLWALLVPQAIAYAAIAGLPPEAGLFAAFAALLAYGLLGTSRQLVVSPTSSTAAISAALVAPMASGDPVRFAVLSATLAMLCGGALVLLGLLRMGFVSRFISAAVQAGFMFGLGLTIIVGQLPKVLGTADGDGDFFEQAADLVRNFGQADLWTVLIGFGSLAVLFAGKKLVPGLPVALLVVVASIALVALFDLDSRGVDIIGAVDGAVPVPEIPAVGFDDIKALLPGALAIAVIGYAESATVAESLADRHRYEVRPDQELIATGGSNLLAGLFQGFMTGGGASQSAANDRAGAQTQVAGLLVAGLTVVTAVALLPLFRDLPQAVLGAIVISAVAGFLNLAQLRRIARLRRDSFLLAIVALAGTLALGVLPGLLIAIALSVLLLLGHLARPGGTALGQSPATGLYVSLSRDPSARGEPGVLIYRLDAPVMFVNAKLLRDLVREEMAAADGTAAVVLDLSLTSELDVESIDVLSALDRDLQRQGTELLFANVHTKARDLLFRGWAGGDGVQERTYRTIEDALQSARRSQPVRGGK